MIRSLAAALLLALLAAPSAQAQSGDSTYVYSLAGPSNFAWGCYGPCLCPVSERPITGTFKLKHVGFDGLFENYAVSDVRFFGATGTLRIAGGGTYRVGGEVALQQQLVLDLSVNGEAVQHFDSGLVPGGGISKIALSVSLHFERACFDTVIEVVAARTGTVDAEGAPGAGLSLSPNPFLADTRITFDLQAKSLVTIGIYDVAGRRVGRITDGLLLEPGPHVFSWDGRAVPAGMYFVHMNAGSDRMKRTVVKL
jgi:hypothetical protein